MKTVYYVSRCRFDCLSNEDGSYSPFSHEPYIFTDYQQACQAYSSFVNEFSIAGHYPQNVRYMGETPINSESPESETEQDRYTIVARLDCYFDEIEYYVYTMIRYDSDEDENITDSVCFAKFEEGMNVGPNLIVPLPSTIMTNCAKNSLDGYEKIDVDREPNTGSRDYADLKAYLTYRDSEDDIIE